MIRFKSSELGLPVVSVTMATQYLHPSMLGLRFCNAVCTFRIKESKIYS